MPSGEAFDLYSNPNATNFVSMRKESRRHPRESSSDPSMKRARIEDPPAPQPSKDTTPPPAPVDPTPPAPVDPTPLAPCNLSPPAQPGKTWTEAILSIAYNSANDKLKKLSRHRRRQETFSNVSTMKVDQIFSRTLNEVLSGVLTMSTGWRCLEEMVANHAEEIKTVEERLVEQLKAAEARHAEQLKAVEANHTEQLRAAEEKNSKLGEELKNHKEALVKVTKAKERYKEASVIVDEHFAMPEVVGSKADAFLKANPAEKMATYLFTVDKLNFHKLSPVSDPGLLWSILGSKKKKAASAEHRSDEGEAERVPEGVSLGHGQPHQPSSSPVGCPPLAPTDPDMASHSQDQHAMPGYFICPYSEDFDAFPQASLDPGPSRGHFSDLPVPPPSPSGAHFSDPPAPPPPSTSGSSVLTQPSAIGSEGAPWVGRMAAS
ncbi:uncharacterized protein LOC133825420 [Humulus lupulus]|uniref:uncharacterized protein LOC133825420 n=1 Tax=Humulus lupulus TaxID=3486 RepID=UPI002B40C00A|nr:uncharacterized protein LOC133825420 [Humulus lupulus]